MVSRTTPTNGLKQWLKITVSRLLKSLLLTLFLTVWWTAVASHCRVRGVTTRRFAYSPGLIHAPKIDRESSSKKLPKHHRRYSQKLALQALIYYAVPNVTRQYYKLVRTIGDFCIIRGMYVSLDCYKYVLFQLPFNLLLVSWYWTKAVRLWVLLFCFFFFQNLVIAYV